MIINIFNIFLMLGVVSREDKGGGPLMLDVAPNIGCNMVPLSVVTRGRAPDVGCCTQYESQHGSPALRSDG
jgi:hypothetical protein